MSTMTILLLGCFLGLSAQAIAQTSTTEAKLKFGYFQCRADAQQWTYDPFDKSLEPKYITGAAIMVNGQFRVLPHLSYGVTTIVLQQRVYEAAVCITEDADFEKQFLTYSRLKQAYEEERAFRYLNFLMKHRLLDQFTKEDAEEFK
jgi:hypothetical protein